jgi:hypothetical protein
LFTFGLSRVTFCGHFLIVLISMAVSASDVGRPSVARRLFELDPLPTERLKLETAPRVDTVASFVFTRAAERSWEVLNQHLAANEGAVFWIGGPPGCGKTHFLDYVIALESRAGALDAENARRLICGLEVAEQTQAAQLEPYLLRVIAEQIGADSRSGNYWRGMRGAAALNIALESAKRTGVRAVTVAIDFGLSEYDAAADFFRVLAEVAAKFRQVKFTVIAAGRSAAPEIARRLEVAPRDASEEMIVAVRRARRLTSWAERDAGRAYAGIDTAGFAPDTIFPFHPVALSALRSMLTPPPATIAALSRLAREALETPNLQDHHLVHHPNRLIYPPDLTMNPEISKRVEVSLAPVGRAALKIAQDALTRSLQGNQKELGREIVDTLVMENICGGTEPLTIKELGSRVPMLARSDGADSLPVVRSLLSRLHAKTGGVIRFDGDTARFDPEAAGAPELAAFNSAIALTRRFAPELTAAREIDGLPGRLEKLELAMADAVAAANRTREAISSALRESNLPMPAVHRDTIAQYVELAESGAAATLEIGNDPARLDAALLVIANYERLADAAALLPRMRAMREYLAATGLRASPDLDRYIDRSVESGVAALQTECELLAVELGPRALTGAPRNLDALEARFQKFKWTYVQRYLSAHEEWCAKMERLALAVEDALRYRDALTRLNMIVALGPSEGDELAARVAALAAGVIRCELEGSVAPETTPRCLSCGYTLGAVAPAAELDALMERLRRGLAIKLAALSQNVIARLIREHDRDNRLEGFLKITQAAQTDALVRVLDEKLARYLAQVLDDSLEGLADKREKRR